MDIDRYNSVLEQIGQQYKPESAEYQAIETAAWALLYIQTERLTASFGEYLKRRNDPLTAEQAEDLERLLGESDSEESVDKDA